ncbi:MAG: M48 family metallopeptidase [Anaerolineae bacterium]|nr:M48 family metallopeptidase [Anaerolineae bacterium]
MKKRLQTTPPDKFARQVSDGAVTLTVEATKDNRLRKSIRWTLKQETIQVRFPAHISTAELDRLLEDIIDRVRKQRARARQQNDDDLEQRAQAINTRYFQSELQWHTIRWVGNMKRRLGSCTEGGTTDGDIRISDRIKHWPDYVIDYIVAHELAHRKYPNHSRAFWDYVARYPHTERARGFIDGIAFAEGDDPEALI